MTATPNITSTQVELNPISIGNIDIKTPLSLAPMDGMTNYAFRRLCREHSGEDCGLVCTELLSSQILTSNSRKSRFKFDWRSDEFPFAVQIYGNEPTVMAEAAKIVADAGAAIIDINMGCWVPKIARKGGGAGLLKDVCTAAAAVEAVVNAVDVPVTVKVRAGLKRDNPTAIEFARVAEQAGVKMIAVHWRFAEQGFRDDPIDWSIIGQVKDAVKEIPVLGNGDVHNADDATKMMAETGCDGVMIGRAAAGHPWLFAQIAHKMRTGKDLERPSLAVRAQAALDHAHVMLETDDYPEPRVALHLRGRLHQYFDEFVDMNDYMRTLRENIVRVNSIAEIDELLLPLATEEVTFDELA